MAILRNLSITAALAMANLLWCVGPNAQAETTGDRLWIWGHPAGVYNAGFLRPMKLVSSIEPVAAAERMGLKNMIFVRYDGKPAPPFDAYYTPFGKLDHVYWSLVAAGGGTSQAERDAAFSLAEKNKNLAGFILDDFFHEPPEGNAADPLPPPKPDRSFSASLTPAELHALHGRQVAGRKLPLMAVVYSGQVKPGARAHIAEVDQLCLWTWRPGDLEHLEANFAALEKLAPDKQLYLGCYMYNFHECKPLPVALMQRQVELGCQWLKAGRIKGMIFLATPNVDVGLEAVEWTRQWIRTNGNQPLSMARAEGQVAPSAQRVNVGEGTVEFAVLGEDQHPLPCRIHVKDRRANPRFPPQLPHWADHFVCPGTVELRLPADDYTFEIERGPEYARESGTFHLGAGETQRIERRLKRTADMAAKGWYSGELHVHRPLEQVPLLMQAEDLHVAPVITWWNSVNPWKDRRPTTGLLTRLDGDRFLHAMAGEDEREGGALLYFGLDQPLAITGSGREYPSPMKFVLEARQHPGVWIDIEKPFWWDVPVWLASGRIDSMGLANNHLCRSSMSEKEAWGKPRDAARLPPPRGNGYWSQEIYYHVLNSGLRVPPSAGSASGVLPNPVGYNRVYVQVGREMTYERWWEGLKAGRSFVTNGPLLLVRANEQLPGYVFTASEGEKVVVRLQAELVSADRVPALEVVVDGRVSETISPEQLAAGRPLTVTFARSGWFLVRAITDVPHTFRFASAAPYYVEIGPAKRTIHRTSVRFFLDWLEERAQRVPRTLHDPVQLEEVLQHHRQAKQFWQGLLAEANAE